MKKKIKFPEQIEEVIDNSRYWKNINILSENYVDLIIDIIVERIDLKIDFFNTLIKDMPTEEAEQGVLFAPAIMALKDMKKVFKGEEEEDDEDD